MRRFAIRDVATFVGFCIAQACGLSAVHGQVVPAYWAGDLTNAGAAPITNQARQTIGFYGGQQALSTLSQMPRRTPIQSAPSQPLMRPGKPFQAASSEPTVSPYLNLFRGNDGNTDSALNYYSLVRPQLEQQDAVNRQHRELQQLQRQARKASTTTVGPKSPSAGLPPTGNCARFMDTAQFYSAWQR